MCFLEKSCLLFQLTHQILLCRINSRWFIDFRRVTVTNYFKYQTTNHEVLELKKQLKFNQARIKRISKLVKFNLEFYDVWGIKQMGFLQKDCSHKFKYIYFECYQCEFCGKYSVNGWN